MKGDVITAEPTAAPPRRPASGRTAQLRLHILDVAAEGLQRLGPKRLTLVELAQLAGVSRPTLYRHFASKEDLLTAVAEQHFACLSSGMAEAIRGFTGSARLDAALVYLATFQSANPTRHISEVEPGYFLARLQSQLPEMERGLLPLIAATRRSADPDATVLAGLIARIAISHALLPHDDPDALLRELRAAARLA